jgi:hypothetical protein
MADVFLDFKGVDEVVHLVNTGGALNYMLTGDTSGCALIGSEITLDYPPIAEGSVGQIFNIKFENGNASKFVVKVVYDSGTMETFMIEKGQYPLQEVTNYISTFSLEFTPQFILTFNNIPSSLYNEPAKESLILRIPPQFGGTVYPCKIEQNVNYLNQLWAEESLKIGDYVCNSSVIEKAISSFVSTLIEKQLCPHYVQHIAFAHCDVAKSYIFMEKLEGDVQLKDNKLFIKAMIFQVLITLTFIHEIWNLGHQDLHLGNVFVAKASDISWRGKPLDQVDWWRYKIGDTFYYIPKQKYIIKLGDWGYSGKYTHPKLLINDLVMDKYKSKIPNFYCPIYDILTFLVSVLMEAMDYGFKETYLFAWKVLSYISERTKYGRRTDRFLNECMDGMKDENVPLKRPLIHKIEEWVTTRELLQSNLFSEFEVQPKTGKYLSYTQICNLSDGPEALKQNYRNTIFTPLEEGEIVE